MEIIYIVVIKVYRAGIFLFSFFNEKARKWIDGRKNIFLRLAQTLSDRNEKRIWFHCASLGEFEQGKPIIEAIKKGYPQNKILLTFFSPSGYEIKKNDPICDYIFYLPLDGAINAKKFIDIVKPSMVFFIKYEFWHFYIKELKKRKIPLYFISARFSEGQIFFRWYGKFFDKMLRRITHLFVQDQHSLELLYGHSISQVTVSGDTRFDRVYQGSMETKSFPEIEKFCKGKKIFIAGSTWQADENIVAGLIESAEDDFKFIIAPHEIKEDRIADLMNKFSQKSIRYSELIKLNQTDARVLIIDNVGMLSSLYKYGNAAYIGGAFNKGLHNILEAIVFGLPVFFGSGYKKFPEAIELVKSKSAFSIYSGSDLMNKMKELFSSEEKLENIRKANKNYIIKNKGATNVVMNYLKMNFGEKISVFYLLFQILF
jgi:3-deoxy-D-manno-octulosonic-acid transferase